MADVFHDASSRPSETARRLRATLRALLSPGIWLVLATQIALVFAMQRPVPEDATPLEQGLAAVLTTSILMLFFYLQAGAYHALTLGRGALSAADTLRAGRTVFVPFMWLTLKAGALLIVALNMLIYISMMITGLDLKTTINASYPLFVPLVGLLAFVFVYWLPFVFVSREFRLFPSLKAGLRIARARLPQSVFLALMVLAPILVSSLLPAGIPLLVDLVASVVGGLMGWIAYVYCAEVLQDQMPEDRSDVTA